jgi:hypothetical protein
MAVQESDREDLMRQATVFRRRMELSLTQPAQILFVGLRDDGGFSIFFGADPVYHFDARGSLRRCYFRGDLYRTQGTTLSRLSRQRSAGESNLIRHDLTPEELQQFLHEMDERLANLAMQLQSGLVQILRQIPTETDMIPLLKDELQRVLHGQQRLASAIKA